MLFCGFDLETPQDDPIHGLQPWRAKTSGATIKTFAAYVEDKSFRTAQRMPTKSTCAKMLRRAATYDHVLIGWNVMFDVAWLCAIGLENDVKNCKWMDAMLLLKRLDPWRAKDHGGVGFGLKEAVAERWPEHAGYGLGDEVTRVPETEDEWLRMLRYNLKDAMFTCLLGREYWDRLSPDERRGAMIEAQTIPDVALSYINGVYINEEAIDPFDRDVKQVIAENLPIFGADMATVRSPKKLGALLYDTWGYEPVKLSPKGNPATDKESLLKLAIQHPNDPRFKALMALRKCNTQSSKFIESVRKSIAYHGAPVTRPTPNMSGTYCVPGDVEVLTPSGWTRLDKWTGGDILQVHPDMAMEFLPAEPFYGGIASEMVRIDHPGMKCLFTKEHTIPHLAQKTCEWQVVTAKDLLKRRLFVPVGGTAKLQGQYTESQMMLFAALQADGWFDVTRFRIRFCFKKQRKIDRIKQLLDANNLRYKENTCAGRTYIVIYKRDIPCWLSPDKKFLGAWIFDTTPDALASFVRELRYWDGKTHEDGGISYTSSVESNADWAHTAALVSGFKARKNKCSGGMYTVHISEDHVRPIANIIPSSHASLINCHIPVYCTKTITGFWLARSNGTIFVTGNTGRFSYGSFLGKGVKRAQTGIALHQWERGKVARNLLTAPPGFLLAEFDFSGQEMRLMAIESEDETMLDLFANNGDGHAYMGASIENMDYNFVREQAETDERAKQARYLGKFANLSLQYRVGIDTMMVRALTQYNLQLWRQKAQHIKNTYLRTYPGVPRYWKEAIRQASKDGYAFTRGHRRVPLPNLNVYEQQQTAINFRIQGTGGDMKSLAIYVCSEFFDPDLVYAWDLHDALFMYVRDDEYAVLKVKNLKEILSNLPYKKAWGWEPQIPLPVDAKIGKTWGSLKGV